MSRIASLNFLIFMALAFAAPFFTSSISQAKPTRAKTAHAKAHSKNAHQKAHAKSTSRKHAAASKEPLNPEPIDRTPANAAIPATGYKRAALYMAKHDGKKSKKKEEAHRLGLAPIWSLLPKPDLGTEPQLGLDFYRFSQQIRF